MAVRRTQLATLAYAPEVDYDVMPESPAGTRIAVINESLEPSTKNEQFAESLDAGQRSASLAGLSVSASITFYLRSICGTDLIKAAMRGRVMTDGSGPYSHLIQTKARDYSFLFQRSALDGKTQLYSGCRASSATIEIPTSGGIRVAIKIIGARESKLDAPILTSIDEEEGEPFFSTDAHLIIDEEDITSALISAAVDVVSEESIGRFGPMSQVTEEAWVGKVTCGMRATLYASDLERLGLEASEETHLVELWVKKNSDEVRFSSATARISGITRPYIAVGDYQQTITLLCLNMEATIVNSQSTL